MTMGERIKQLRLANNMTQEELGKYIGVKKAAIRKYEKNEVKNMKRSSIEILSNLFNVSPSYLMCLENENQIESRTMSISLISEYKKDIEYSIKNFTLKTIVVDFFSENTIFALLINDAAMSPLLDKGDIAVISSTKEFNSGKTYFIRLNNLNMIRKVIKTEEGYELHAMNAYYPVEKVKETDNFEIIGMVIRAENQSAFK